MTGNSHVEPTTAERPAERGSLFRRALDTVRSQPALVALLCSSLIFVSRVNMGRDIVTIQHSLERRCRH